MSVLEIPMILFGGLIKSDDDDDEDDNDNYYCVVVWFMASREDGKRENVGH